VAGWQLDGFVGLLNDEPEFNPDEEGPNADQFRRDAIVGLRTGYAFGDGAVFALLEAANSLVMFDSPTRPVDREADSFWFGASGGYNLPPWGRVQVFPAVGLGIVVWDVQGVDETETDFTLNYGLGAKYLFNRRLGVRWDARMHQVPSALLDTRRRLGDVGDEGADLFGLEMSVGVTFRPGR
jgi:hypothetical protein